MSADPLIACSAQYSPFIFADLAMIFQPGIIAHKIHEMAPSEHVISQKVLEFLIEHQDHFLLGMQLVSLLRRVDTQYRGCY